MLRRTMGMAMPLKLAMEKKVIYFLQYERENF